MRSVSKDSVQGIVVGLGELFSQDHLFKYENHFFFFYKTAKGFCIGADNCFNQIFIYVSFW